MSATNRGAARVPLDVYESPAWTVRRLLEAVDLPGGDWLEPSAGSGAIIRAVQSVRQDIRWTAVEVRPECLQPLRALDLWSVQIDSFTAPKMPLRRDRFDVVIGNPPYGPAFGFVVMSVALSPIVAFLMRLNWLSSEGRCSWLSQHVPDTHVLPNRPCFVGDHGDATEYAWFVFRGERTSGVVTILNTTPLEERAHQDPVDLRQMALPLGGEQP